MDNAPPKNPTDDADETALEGSSTSVETGSAGALDGKQPERQTVDATTNAPQAYRLPPKKHLGDRLRVLNIYLLLFVLVIIVAAGVVVATYLYSKDNTKTSSLQAASLSQNTLSQLANSDVNVGTNGQVLNVESSAIFAGKVLIRNSLAVAGDLQIGGSLSLTGVTVVGTSTFNQVQIAKNLAVTGDTALQGQLSVQNNIAVTGNATFGGSVSAAQLTTSALQLNGDLNLTHHITAGGATPSRTNGTALGSGGTTTLSGSDTSGTLSINTGDSPAAGCFATISFQTKFNATPHVLLTPVGSSAAGLAYYVTRSSSSFSICSATAAPSSVSFAFDYLVLD